MTVGKLSPKFLMRMRDVSMRRRFLLFSVLLFLVVLVSGVVVFTAQMGRLMRGAAGDELSRVIEVERLKMERRVNCEITLARKLADSPLIQRHLLDPENAELRRTAFEEIEGYRKAFAENNTFWISDIDKKYYFNGEYVYTLNPEEPSSWWYNEFTQNPSAFSLTANFDVGIKKTMLWIDVPVLGPDHSSIGIVGTGLDLSNYVSAIYQDYSGDAELYFLNAAGEITGSANIGLVENRAMITAAIAGLGEEIFAGAEKVKGTGGIEYFDTYDGSGIIAVGEVPDLDWYIAAVQPFNIADALDTPMTVLFSALLAIIAVIIVIFNLFVAGLLGPLNELVGTMNRIAVDWDMRRHKDEVKTLGQFFDMAITDSLTGVFNRKYLEGMLEKVVRDISRANGWLSVLMIDVDCFKQYNDTYGHHMGDGCLRSVAEAIDGSVTREDDFAARYGGEEFTVVLPNTGIDGTRLIAGRILESVRERNIPHAKSKVSDRVTVSIGAYTCLVTAAQSGAEYIKRADEALYASKENGRDRITFYGVGAEENP